MNTALYVQSVNPFKMRLTEPEQRTAERKKVTQKFIPAISQVEQPSSLAASNAESQMTDAGRTLMRQPEVPINNLSDKKVSQQSYRHKAQPVLQSDTKAESRGGQFRANQSVMQPGSKKEDPSLN